MWFDKDDRPAVFSHAIDAINAFFRCGSEPTTEEADRSHGLPYSFRADDAAIMAAFQREYGIDLSSAKMHWWRFNALLRGLVEHSFSERVQYRLADLSEITDTKTRARYQRLQTRYSLNSHGETRREPRTVEEYNAMILAQMRGEW